MVDTKLADCRVVTGSSYRLSNYAHQEVTRPMSEADLDSLIRERFFIPCPTCPGDGVAYVTFEEPCPGCVGRGVLLNPEMVERGRFPILDTTAMFASKMLGITHEAAMDREDIRQMATIVARAVLLAALTGEEEE